MIHHDLCQLWAAHYSLTAQAFPGEELGAHHSQLRVVMSQPSVYVFSEMGAN